MRRIYAALLLLFSALPSFAAKDIPFQTLDWPASGAPVLRLTFSRFKTLGSSATRENTYVTEATAENVSEKMVGNINLLLYVFDKAHARVGDGNISLANVGPHQIVKFEITLNASGTPASVSIATSAPRDLSVTINSVPQGASFKLDGKDAGLTPKIVEVGIGKHMLEFSKEGYSTGKFPFEMGPRDANGGSISYELGASSHDTIELRDGSILSGDLLSIDVQQVQIRIGGNIQTYDRNQIKRISLTQRDPVP